jgi:2-octaprenyl-6-methoxyphenol hydroxylase
MSEDYDVAIIGGGLVGASLALALTSAADVRIRVALIESYPLKVGISGSDSSSRQPSHQPSYDARSTALAWGSRLIYEELNLWPALSEHVTPIKHIHVSHRGYFGATRLRAEDHKQDALGYVVENQWIGQCLLSALAARPDIDLICPDSVEEVSTSMDGARLQLKNRGMISAAVAVLADGGRSGLRDKLAMDVVVHDYQQTALIANLDISKHHAWTAYERFTQTGPMALLPLGESALTGARSALVWTLPTAQTEAIMRQSDADFLHNLQQAFGFRLGKFTAVGERFSYPLLLSLCKEQVRPGLVVIGNAAHTLHPVAGQGYNLALRAVMRLASTLQQAKREGQPFASHALLSSYLPAQNKDRMITVSFSNLLTQLFGARNPLLGTFLGLGLAGLDVTPFAKSGLSERAMGLAQAKPVL